MLVPILIRPSSSGTLTLYIRQKVLVAIMAHKMKGGVAGNCTISKWLAEKDGGIESETELSTCEFSKLNISPSLLHNRPLRSQSKPGVDRQTEKEHRVDTREGSSSSNKGFTRCLRSRAKQITSKVSVADETLTSSLVNLTGCTNNLAQYLSPHKGSLPQYMHDDTVIKRSDTVLAVALTNAMHKSVRSRQFDAASLYSVTSDEFNESDDELISINGDSNSECTNIVGSCRVSSKRKRTTTLSADLEVESLLSPGADDCVYSGDNFSVSDFSETEEPITCEVPKKRLCNIAPAANHRPYLDLEKMQDKVEKSTANCKRRPKAVPVRIMYFSPINNMSMPNRPTTRSVTNRELVMTSRFCPLTPVESFSSDCVS